MPKRYVVRRMTAVETKSGDRVMLNNDNVNDVLGDVSKENVKKLVDAQSVVELEVDEPEDATPAAAAAAVDNAEAESKKKSTPSKKE